MSAKKRKSVSPWSVCDECKAVILQKDVLNHKENSCPPNLDSWTFPVIVENQLYTFVETFQTSDASLKYIPSDERNDLVLLPLQAIQLLKVAIGDPVLIKSKKIYLIKTVWPQGEKQDTNFRNAVLTAQLSKDSISLNFLSTQSAIIISKYDKGTLSAVEIIIECESNYNLELDQLKNMLSSIQEENLNKFYTVNNKFFHKHYGKKLTFKVVSIIARDIGVSIDNKLNEFYLLTSKTVWKIKGKEEPAVQKCNLLNSLGGLKDVITELQDLISRSLYNPETLPGFQVTRGILVYGSGGVGKTTLIEALAQACNCNIIRIECAEIFSKYLGETEKKLKNYFNQARDNSPSIILIDELDTLCPKVRSRSEQEKRILTTLSTLMDSLHNDTNSFVVVVAATSKINSIDKSLRRSGRFDKEIEIQVPNPKQRFEILKILTRGIKHSLSDQELRVLSDSCHGFVGADLCSLVTKAVFENLKGPAKNPVSLSNFKLSLSKIKPSAMREIMIEIPNVKWSDIGGQKELKLKLKQAVEWPLKHSASFERLGISPPKGVLMFGPPGCSKTLFAKALATESELNFISVKGPELFSKWVGESEKAVREVFRRARQAAPSIIFFDELDALGGERSSSTTGGSNVQERVLAQLLTELDGVEPLGNVTVVAATNRPDRIDPALLRPGRLDRIIYVSLPDRETRKEIFEIQFRKTPISGDVLVEELSEKTEGYSGAEIVAVCHEAALKALEDNLNAVVVNRDHFLFALGIITPRTSRQLLDIYSKYLKR